jgi:hypothetical protein
MVGTSAADTFVFLPDFGRETVKKFDAAHDVLQIDHRLVGDQSVADFLASGSVSQHGKDTWITFDEGKHHATGIMMTTTATMTMVSTTVTMIMPGDSFSPTPSRRA